ncbi:MAG TPA: nuclear transport factor 2 family protein [Daejeonella sp.]|uniref:nuclear transport factor 2 family protein n=1 Tax=Daejeonella sp. TaxID=2805397 RepID=UPI002ED8DC36
MKKIFLLILLLTSINSFAQKTQNPEEKEILLKVQQFFDALEKQDTVLFKSTLLTNGQVWAISEKENAAKYSMRQFSDFMKTLINPARVIQERMLSSEVKIHDRIAMAWVPYSLDISGKFSHCGVDLFTFLKTDEGWKIATAAYTIEQD